MIQVQEALSIIMQNSCKMPIKKVKVRKSVGYILAEAIYSPMNMPPFRQAAMDGYAFKYGDSRNYKVVNTIQAGDYPSITVASNEALRIFTGAYVPDSVDTVVMQEHITKNNDGIEVLKMPNHRANIREEGEQIQKGALVLEKDSLLTPASVGYISCLGINEVVVYSRPKVAIVLTGNELVKVGQKLPKGKIYESNSAMLTASLQQMGISKIKSFYTKDTLLATKKTIKKVIPSFDIVLISGGISVGDYDYVKEALLLNDVVELFYKINQKPGKPMFFGKKNNALIFALPGNPASTLTCFYVYVYPCLKNAMGFSAVNLMKINKKINIAYENTTGKSLFLKGHYNDEIVKVLESQSSAMLNTFALANALVYIPHDQKMVHKGEQVSVLTFNN